MRMDRKFSLTLLTLALAGSLCACSGNTTEATPTPDHSPMPTPEARSGIVGYGYNGYNDIDGGMWEADNGATWNAGDAARDAVNDVRRGIDDMTRNAQWGATNIW